MPLHHKITFHSEIYNQQDELLNVGDVTLYFMQASTMKRCEMPDELKKKLGKYF
jgi:acyl-CoA thioester hydrolase